MFSQNKRNTYPQEWKKVEDFDNKSLPKSAIKEAEAILQKAIDEKNTPQIMKVYVYLNKLNAQIDDRTALDYFSKLEALLNTTESVADKALLHSSLAIAYRIHYQDDAWNIKRKTDLADDIIPEDMKEWTKSTFANKIYNHLEAAIKDKEALLKENTKSYDDIIELGEDSRNYRPTLYDFLMYENLVIAKQLKEMESSDLASAGFTLEQLTLPAKDFVRLSFAAKKSDLIFVYYQQYLANLLKRNMTSSVILLELDKLRYLKDEYRELSSEDVVKTLKALEEIYRADETTVEIIDYLVDEIRVENQRFIPPSVYTFEDDGLKEEQRKVAKTKSEWLKKGIATYPKYRRIGILKNKLAELESPMLELTGETVYHSSDSIKLKVSHKNNQSLKRAPTLNLYRLDGKTEKMIKAIPVKYTSKDIFYADEVELSLGVLPYGKYIVRGSLENKKNEYAKLEFVVSDLMTYFNFNPAQNYDVFVVDRQNGKPVQGATVRAELKDKDGKKRIVTLTTDEKGYCVIEDTSTSESYYYNRGSYTVSKGDDNALREQVLRGNYYGSRSVEDEDKLQSVLSLFADRSIYRPGQIVYFKGIFIDEKSKPIINQKSTITLFSANGDKLEEKEMLTNEFGSFADSFILPQNTLPGSYWLESNYGGRHFFMVEEYKRPTFEVKFDTLKSTYSLGDKVLVRGNVKSYTGISLQDADVKFNITRSQFMPWRWGGGNASHFQDGVVKTAEDGSFEIEFTPQASDVRTWYGGKLYTFNISVAVTDLNGETQSGELAVNVGDISMTWQVNVPAQIEKGKDFHINIGAKNLNNVAIDAKGTYAIYTVDGNDSIDVKLAEGTFVTGKQEELARKIKALASGKMRLMISGKDDKNREVKEKADFVLFSYDDKRPPYEISKWVVPRALKFEGDKPAEILFGTSNRDSYILYRLYNDTKVFECRFIRLDNENHKFVIPYRAEFGDGVYVSFTLVKNGVLDETSYLLEKVEEIEKKDGALNVKISVFRDKLRPGDAASWTLNVADADGKPISAEILASMYDISLDQIYPFSRWMMNRPYSYKNFPSTRNLQSAYSSLDHYSVELGYKPLLAILKPWNFDTYKYFLSQFEEQFLLYESAPAPMMRSAKSTASLDGVVSIADVVSEDDMQGIDIAELADTKELAKPTPEAMGGSAENTSPALEIRKNFNETAFFYPQLKTDKEGIASVSFTVPEQTTTWRFRAFAHDKEGQVGMLEKMVVTSKELQITPNMPRFIRQGDVTSISTKISNLSEGALSGEVSIEFFNVIDEKIIKLKVKDAKQKFSLAEGASSAASWTFDVPSDMDMLGVRIVAQSATFSDGEQHALVVLPNRMLVTETMPVDVTKVGEQTFTMDKLVNNKSKTLDNYKLTFEFASNPAWYAVQALPTLSNPTNENALNWFASYYVNSFGASLMKQYPKVKNVINAWLAQGGTKETLVSKLSKNEELKTILLEETPWVMDAKNETEQMQRLSLLFDLNNTNQQTSVALAKLKDLQTPDGGWSWYKGLYSSRSITQYVLFGFANLQHVAMVEHPEQVKYMQMDALKYVDKMIAEDFSNLKKYDKNWKDSKSISTMQLEYLYIRAMYRDIPISKEAREAERFYTEVVSKNWTNLNLYEKSLLAVLGKQSGNKMLADKIAQSIREHATTNDEMGMYWANNKNRVFTSMSAVCSHLFIMEALKENGASIEEQNMMKRWLVKQKQTAVWESTNATIHAIGVLLADGSNWFEDDSNPEIKVGKTVLTPAKRELATGYFKNSWTASEMKPNMGHVTITSQDSKPAYGALYWQYYEDLDKIEKQDGALNINKELYKEQVNEKGKVLVKITEEEPLKVGDKVVVRLVVRTDRDMEFVQLKDMRAACFEPVSSRSGVVWQDKAIYYQAVKDASTNFYFDVMPKGTYVFEYQVYVSRAGEYSNGITSLQCAYAPEFTSHTAGIKVTVKE